MARSSNITFGQVAQIADAMKAAGTRPTARAVRERIGSGSMGTIHKLLQQWTGKASDQDDQDDAAELPAHIQTALMDFIGTEVATACEPLQDELQAAREALDDIAQDNERMHGQYAQLETELENCRQERAAAMAQLNMTRDELRNANKDRERLAEKNTELLRDLDRAQRQIELFAADHDALAELKARHQEALAELRESDKERAVYVERCNAQELKAADLAKRLELTEKRDAASLADLKASNAALAKCTAELSAAGRELAELKAAAPKTVKSPAKKAAAKKPANQELAV